MVHMWKGVRIEDLSRDELIEVIHYLGGEFAKHNEPGAIRARSLGAVEMMKRGERMYG